MHTRSTHVNGKAAQSEMTRAKLLAAGRRLFAERGYAGVGTEEIAQAADVTRGALYYQFENKRDLFRAVFEQISVELMEAVAQRASAASTPFSVLGSGVSAWLEFSSTEEVRRIALLDAPAVLGWENWRATGQGNALVTVMASLEAAMKAGAIEHQPVRPLSYVLMGALDEAALYVALADDRRSALREMDQVLQRIIGAL